VHRAGKTNTRARNTVLSVVAGVTALVRRSFALLLIRRKTGKSDAR
jgi:hypothetical protein